MKHPTTNLQSQQNFVSILLASGLIVSYNLNMTLAASPSTRTEQPSTSSCPPEVPTSAMGTSGLTLTAQGGHKVTVQQNNGSWKAEVHENLPRIGFSRTLSLPVYIAEGVDWQKIARLPEAIQRQYVAVDFTRKKLEATQAPKDAEVPYVYIGKRDFSGASSQSLHAVVSHGYLAQVRKILAKGETGINAVDEQQQSALHRAVIRGHKEIVVLLLEAGADVTLKDDEQKMPLEYAHEDDKSYFETIIALVSRLKNLEGRMKPDSEYHQVQSHTEEIQQNLKEVQNLLNSLELEQGTKDQKYRHFKHRYHNFRASYYKALGYEERASTNATLAEQYKDEDDVEKQDIDTTILLPPPLDEEAQEALAAKITTRPGGASSSTKNAEIQKNLNKIKNGNLFPRSACDRIEALVDQARQLPSSFAHYISISATRDNLERLMHDTIRQPASAQAGAQAEDSNRRQIMHRKQLLARLATLVRSVIDQNRLAFIQNALDCTDQLRDLFFSNLLLTEDNIHRRHQELRQEFDPDKAKWIPEAQKATAKTLMELMDNYKNMLLQNLQEAVDKAIRREEIQGNEQHKAALQQFRFYQKQGENLWAMAMDCEHAQKGRWDDLTKFLQADFAHLGKHASETVMILKQLRSEYATHAYEAYRACCRLADAEKPIYLEDQIKLRGKMALCLYATGRYLEAQLYALGAMRLIFVRYQEIIWNVLDPRLVHNNRKAILQVLPSAQQILAKVQRYTPEGETVPATDQGSTSAVLASTNFGSALGIRTIESQESVQDKDAKGAARIQGAIADDLSKIAKALTHKNDHSLVQYQAAEEDILQTSKCAVRYKIAGGALMANGVVEGGVCVTLGVASILQGAGVIAGTTLGGPVVAIVVGVGLIGFGICSSIALWKVGAALMKKSSIREKLNDTMQQALTRYDQGQPQQFLATLAEEYAPGERLLSIEGLQYGVPVEKIIESLIQYGFRPDGIAYLFNLMGEALSSGKVSIPNCKPSRINHLGQMMCEFYRQDQLIDSAAKLDARIAEMRKKDLMSKIKELGRKLRDFFTLRNEGRLARKYVEDAQAIEMPFTVRLEEMRNIAKMNIVMICLMRDWNNMKGDQDEIAAAKELVQEVRDSMDRYGQLYTRSALRLPAIEECLWAVNGHTNAIKAPT